MQEWRRKFNGQRESGCLFTDFFIFFPLCFWGGIRRPDCYIDGIKRPASLSLLFIINQGQSPLTSKRKNLWYRSTRFSGWFGKQAGVFCFMGLFVFLVSRVFLRDWEGYLIMNNCVMGESHRIYLLLTPFFSQIHGSLGLASRFACLQSDLLRDGG